MINNKLAFTVSNVGKIHIHFVVNQIVKEYSHIINAFLRNSDYLEHDQDSYKYVLEYDQLADSYENTGYIVDELAFKIQTKIEKLGGNYEQKSIMCSGYNKWIINDTDYNRIKNIISNEKI